MQIGKMRFGKFDERYPNGFVYEEGRKYRMGALFLKYQNFKVGINSDRYVSHPIQDHFAHNFGPTQPGFRALSNAILPYFQYQTSNPFTSW